MSALFFLYWDFYSNVFVFQLKGEKKEFGDILKKWELWNKLLMDPLNLYFESEFC